MIKKILGIFICLLLITSISTSSVISETLIIENNAGDSELNYENIDNFLEEEVIDELKNLINKYKEKVKEAEEFCRFCLKEMQKSKKDRCHECFNIEGFNKIFPENIQEKFNKISYNLDKLFENHFSTVGGITKFEIEYLSFWIINFGYILKFWISHPDILLLSIYNEFGLLITGLILVFSGIGMPFGVILLLADALISFGFIGLNELDQGDGLRGEILFLYCIPFPILMYIKPQ